MIGLSTRILRFSHWREELASGYSTAAPTSRILVGLLAVAAIAVSIVSAPNLSGILGAGLALLISTTARLIFVLASFPIFLKMRVPHIFPKIEDFKFMASAAFQPLQLLRGKRLMAADGAD